MEVSYHPKELIDLQEELMHPAHTEFNRNFSQRPRPFDEVLSDICTALGIIVDGTYTPADQLALAKKCTDKLAKMRYDAQKQIVGIKTLH